MDEEGRKEGEWWEGSRGRSADVDGWNELTARGVSLRGKSGR